MKQFERALNRAKPMKGQMNDWQYNSLKNMLPKNLSPKEYDKCIDLICDKIKY